MQVLISREHEAGVSDVELNEHATVSHIEANQASGNPDLDALT